MKRRFDNNESKQLKTPLKRSGFAWSLVFLLLGIHVFFAVSSSSTGVKMARLEEEIDKLESENENLTKELLGSTSLSKLNQNAEELGFRKIEDTLYLQTGQAQAKAR